MAEQQKLKEEETPKVAEQLKVGDGHKINQKFKIYFGSLGRDSKEIELDEGATLGDVVKMEKVDKMEIRLNKEAKPMNTKLKDGDIVVAVPESIVGG